MEQFIKDPIWVARHGFLPFIHVVLKTKRRKGKHLPPEYKERNIYYASHLDRYVYQWYSSLTSIAYESYVKTHGFGEAPIAYRSLDGKTNIHFAKEAFDFIRGQVDSLVFISDFSKYFDTLDHVRLKEKLKKVFGVRELPKDHYQVFKSMINFRFFDLKDIAEVLGTTEKMLKHRRKKPERLLLSELMRSMKKEYLRSNPNYRGDVSIGIPQGAPISAVYANVYMIDFDEELSGFVKSVGGFYRRYSDDIICVVPYDQVKAFRDLFYSLLSEALVNMSPDKTKEFRVKNGKPFEIDEFYVNSRNCEEPAIVEYLGFAYNGMCVRLRERTISRYYQKLTRRLFLLQYLANQKSRIVGRKKLYARSSHLGEANRRHLQGLRSSDKPLSVRRRNFFTYERNAEEVFAEKQMRHQVGGHWRRIHRFISQIDTRNKG